MSKMFFSSQNCQGVTLENGGSYKTDKSGMISVESSSDIKALQAGGYVLAGSVARARKYWVCDDCNFDANLNHCPRCDSENLRKVEG